MIGPMALAQRARDAQLAEVTMRAANDGRLPLVFAGNGHIRRDYGIPLHLQSVHPGIRVFAVGLIEEGEGDPPRLYDAVWSVPSLVRQDPCVELRKRFAPRG
jgi:uncharacterized iron-regulated protein